MTFLVLGGTWSEAKDPLNGNGCIELDGLHKNVVRPGLAVFTSRPLQPWGSPARQVFFDGYAFAPDGTLHHANLATGDLIRHAVSDAIEGVFCLLRLPGPNCQDWSVTTDRLGQYPVFHAITPDGFAISDDLNLLRNVVEHCGLACPHDPMQAAMHTVWGTGFVPRTPYEPLHVLPARYGYFGTGSGTATVREVTTRRELMDGYGSYAEAIGDMQSRLTARCQGILDRIDAGWNRIVDVTGGLDSRMTLAGFLSTGHAQDMGYFTLGSFATRADRKVSDNLLGLFGLSPGWAVMRNARSRYSPLATVSAGIHRYFGMKSWNFTDYGDLYLEDYCRVTGFFGEMMKAHGAPIIHGERPATGPEATVDAFLSRMPRKMAFLTQDGYSGVRADLLAYWQELMAEVPRDRVNTFVYFEQKSKFHFGLHSSVANKFRISLDPLQDSRSVAISAQLEYADLKSARIAFDLIYGLGGADLAYAPFAGNVWPTSWDSPGHARAVSGMTAIRDASQVSWPEVGGQRVFEFDTTSPPVVLDVEKAIAGLKTTEALGFYDKALIILADAIPVNDRFWDVFERRAITPERLAPATPAKFKQNKHRLVSMMVHYLDLAHAPNQTARQSVQSCLPTESR